MRWTSGNRDPRREGIVIYEGDGVTFHLNAWHSTRRWNDLAPFGDSPIRPARILTVTAASSQQVTQREPRSLVLLEPVMRYRRRLLQPPRVHRVCWAVSHVAAEVDILVQTRDVPAEEGLRKRVVPSSSRLARAVEVQAGVDVIFLAGEQEPRGGLGKRRVVVRGVGDRRRISPFSILRFPSALSLSDRL
jgi:hypothetical protein